MTKIIIVDYSLEIVIAIINNDYFEQIYAIVWSCMPYFYINIYLKKGWKHSSWTFIAFYNIEPQMSTIHWFGFFFKQKKVKLCMV